MLNFINKNFYLALFITILTMLNNSFAQTNNNSYVFNGESSQLYILDGQPVNTDANQNGFKFFNSNSSNKQITVQAWVYLIGDTPAAYFSIGNNNTMTVNTSLLPAFQWLAISGTYDGSKVKIYSGGALVASANFTINTGYTSTNGVTGLFVGKSITGAFRGLIDEIRIFNTALSANNINNSGGNGNPAENFPSSLAQYLTGRWSFTEFSYYSGIKALNDLSTYKNHLRVFNIDEILKSKNPPLFVVNSTGDGSDTNPGDGIAVTSSGTTTLRAAIQEANALAGRQTIYFYIPGTAPYVIQPGSVLPYITEQVFLNATSQKGYLGSPLVQVNGLNGGLTITGGSSTMRGLALNNSAGYSLTLSASGGNNIESNKIAGVSINSSGNNINGNTISNSTTNGILILAGAINNLIGNSSANNITGNAGYGISIADANGNQILNNTFGNNGLGGVLISNSAGIVTGNTLSGNTGVGITLNGGTGSQISNNTIGTNTGGGVSLSNGGGNLNGNIITGNTGFGISVNAGTGNQISNNICGWHIFIQQ
ncbi:MAG: right-handed parallel beta-helix repeat-containing protein [Ignavibacteriaceae bacterium]|nr:right-handed parallel beta-helix repeat-containing protein [Ignavibacteriaceae bacterium]